MIWRPVSTMDIRLEFVLLARQPGADRRALCRNFDISPQTGYSWLARYAEAGINGLQDRSRKPLNQPRKSGAMLESQVVGMRRDHPAWGGRKISRVLADQGQPDVAPSTVTRILHRYGLISAEASDAATPFIRFERDVPNALLQVDFKGTIQLAHGQTSPLTMIDDHSRFNLLLEACPDMKTATVQRLMERAFRRYGLPAQINFDNGSPWGSPSAPGQLSTLAIWLILLGIEVTYSRPYHPQTNGKIERFHRTLMAELFNRYRFADAATLQQALDAWREDYNLIRPHEALGLATPVSRYRPSERRFPDRIDPPQYAPDDVVLKVGWGGMIRFKGRDWKLSAALINHYVGLRPRIGADEVYDVFFAHYHCLTIELLAQ
ncbi:IS481 family transposase [Amantichitinum ursilacus]|uniref:Integrase core domain protein n=1 Tax=Amantichitinum ursilacus TaxID=857265 RepID=A0A0N0GMH1_9NEIS|nr:IS481 family transposase [Amantichitinum ursilacus]KPC50972.1 Integrase core domain protein [Amantichitinum ursilacus]